jgi:quinol monooxygenase YgiN
MDMVHIGVVMTANLAIALYTPPVGGTLFVAAKLARPASARSPAPVAADGGHLHGRAAGHLHPGAVDLAAASDPEVDATGAVFFLYELYDDEAAFAAHLETPHFKAFDREVAPWVVGKVVHAWRKLG